MNKLHEGQSDPRICSFYVNFLPKLSCVCVIPPPTYSAFLNFAKHVVVCHDGLHDRI